ncbi:hypothetical protein THAOC_08147, partial [Thalassiosira oceanica]
VTWYQMIATNQDTEVFSIGDRDTATKMSWDMNGSSFDWVFCTLHGIFPLPMGIEKGGQMWQAHTLEPTNRFVHFLHMYHTAGKQPKQHGQPTVGRTLLLKQEVPLSSTPGPFPSPPQRGLRRLSQNGPLKEDKVD